MLADNRQSIQIKKEDLAVRNLERIVKTVLIISQRQGFHGMSLRQLSQQSRLSMGALYNYFGSKEELLQMIYRQGQKQIHQLLPAWIARSQSAAGQLMQAVCCHLYLSEALVHVFYFFFMEGKHLRGVDQKKAVALERSTEIYFEEIIQRGMDGGEFQAVDVSMTASAVKSLLQDWYLKRYKYRARKISVDDYARFALSFVFRYLGVRDAATL
ncbi:MAG: TetR/AcrR family transcriptional regulator [Leptospiraceae bacterium]|nr:TetR/AcrR family transcriptional regulator [Leptospiraceae bacterium]